MSMSITPVLYAYILFVVCGISISFHSFITLRAKLSGAMYCYRSCLCVFVFATGGRAGGVCYHDSSKLCASIFTKMGLWVKVMTSSSWLNFGRPAPQGRGSAAGESIFGFALLQPARSISVYPSAFSFIYSFIHSIISAGK